VCSFLICLKDTKKELGLEKKVNKAALARKNSSSVKRGREKDTTRRTDHDSTHGEENNKEGKYIIFHERKGKGGSGKENYCRSPRTGGA